MPTNYILFGRPKECDFCVHAYYGLLHMVKEAQIRDFNIVDLAGSDCVKDKIFQAIADYDPLFFFGLGHGSANKYADNYNQFIWESCTTQNLADRIVYLWSCATAIGLGPDIVNEKGGLAFAGFNISWSWIGEETWPKGDPYDDRYSRGFFEAGNELTLAMLQLKTFREAGEQSVAKYNEWINYWKNEGSGDSRALEAIKLLVKDRDGLVLLGDLNATLIPPIDCTQFKTKDECIAHQKCNWWNNSCHNLPPSCEEINNEVDCLEYGCYWYDGACHRTCPIDDSKDFIIEIKGVNGPVWNADSDTKKIHKP